jgi:hypothetical protein
VNRLLADDYGPFTDWYVSMVNALPRRLKDVRDHLTERQSDVIRFVRARPITAHEICKDIRSRIYNTSHLIAAGSLKHGVTEVLESRWGDAS